MDWPAWYCLVVLFVGVFLMAFDIMGPDFAMMAMLISVMIPGEAVISVEKALAGFSNEGLLTVAGVITSSLCGASQNTQDLPDPGGSIRLPSGCKVTHGTPQG